MPIEPVNSNSSSWPEWANPVLQGLFGLGSAYMTAYFTRAIAEFNFRSSSKDLIKFVPPVRLIYINHTVTPPLKSGEKFKYIGTTLLILFCFTVLIAFPSIFPKEFQAAANTNWLSYANYIVTTLFCFAIFILRVVNYIDLDKRYGPEARIELESEHEHVLFVCRKALRAIGASVTLVETFETESGRIGAKVNTGQMLIIDVTRQSREPSKKQRYILNVRGITQNALHSESSNKGKTPGTDGIRPSPVHGLNVSRFIQALSDLEKSESFGEEVSEHKVKPEIGKFKRTFGSAKGLIKVATDFDAPLPDDIMKHFE
ncbi:DUF2281 domain-containing protein [Gloeobacter morelensis]|uniref:Uncharacterized protein n=1 Tax=Gloeobacter morelensis MG652769 TaxID=2781736 RepID=A0ABY3PR74_9CYAN|nr:DUF2281 domain-containing protein [Gloeobacter morelensis]UFP96208.1 hypothetical protein ISF26_08385 [Gloeobacter morelensis MG652769]